MSIEWETDDTGYSEATISLGLPRIWCPLCQTPATSAPTPLGPSLRNIVAAAAWKSRTPGARRTWETSIAVRSEGKAPSVRAGRKDAESALRRDAERIVEALGGMVKWVK